MNITRKQLSAGHHFVGGLCGSICIVMLHGGCVSEMFFVGEELSPREKKEIRNAGTFSCFAAVWLRPSPFRFPLLILRRHSCRNVLAISEMWSAQAEAEGLTLYVLVVLSSIESSWPRETRRLFGAASPFTS